MQTRFDQYRRLLTIAEAGLLLRKRDVFDKERYEELRTIALELLGGIGTETSAELFLFNRAKRRISHTENRCSSLHQAGG